MKTISLEAVLSSASSGYWGKEPGTLDADVLVIRNGDVQDNGVRWDALPLRGFTNAEVRRSTVQEGDLLLTTSGDCGRIAMIESTPTAQTCASNFVRRLRFDDRVLARYAFHYMRTPRFRTALEPFIRGAVMKNLSTREAFPAVQLPIPTLDEQRRIAAILDQVDAIRTKRRQALAHLDALTQSIFHSMFGEEPTGADVASIATAIRTGPFGSQLRHSEFVDSGVAVLGLDNVVGNDFQWVQRRYITAEKYAALTRYTVHPGDVLISIMGTTGRCVVVPDGIPTAITTKHLCAITPDTTIEPLFLRAAFLWHRDARAHLLRQTKGSIMDGLNMSIIKAMPIPVPTIAAQRTFADSTEHLAVHRATVASALAADDALFASLQSRAFRGDL